MLKMSQVETIKDLQAKGLGPVAISERLNSKRQTLPTFELNNRYEIILLRSQSEEGFSMGREDIRVKWEALIQAFRAIGQ